MAAGTSHFEAQAQAGLKLFAEETGPAELDLVGAEKHKAQVDAQIAALDDQIAQLTGKDNKKERSTKGKEVSDLKVQPQYIDACKVVKGMEPKSGFFVIKAAEATKPVVTEAAPAEATPDAKKEKEKKLKKESAGLSPAETKELEQLKKDIVERKTQLKSEGLSGGQQNKDAQIVGWVNRMNELKEKEAPGSTQADKKKDTKKGNKTALSSEEAKELDTLRGEIDVYKHRLKTEFGYNNKDMKADEDLREMEARIAMLEKRG